MYKIFAVDPEEFADFDEYIRPFGYRADYDTAMQRAKEVLTDFPNVDEVYIVDKNNDVVASSIAHMYLFDKPQAINMN